MTHKAKQTLAICAALLFLLLILLVRRVDVAAIGPKGTEIGLSGLNGAFHALTGVKLLWYEVTQKLGLLALAVAAGLGVVGLVQLVRRRNLLRVDRELIALGALFVIVIGLYLLFEIAIVNYRPVLMEGDAMPEASFPSSHTVLVFAVLGGTAMILPHYVKSVRLRVMLTTICLGLIAIMVIGRLICGVHWLTDILGGVLLSVALLSAFSIALE